MTQRSDAVAHIKGCLAQYPLGCLGLDCTCPCHTLSAEQDATGACSHDNVRTFRSVPPHSKCLDCGSLVERRWVSSPPGAGGSQ